MKRGRRRSVLLIAVSLLVAAIVVFRIWAGVAERLNRGKCSDNLRALGQAILLYQNDSRGKWPPDWGTLAALEDITASVFTCPNRHHLIPENLSIVQLHDWVNTNSDYIYLPGKIDMGEGSNMIVTAYEIPEDHDGGSNFLFADGSTRFYEANEASKIISQLQSGINPPHFESQGQHIGFK